MKRVIYRVVLFFFVLAVSFTPSSVGAVYQKCSTICSSVDPAGRAMCQSACENESVSVFAKCTTACKGYYSSTTDRYSGIDYDACLTGCGIFITVMQENP